MHYCKNRFFQWQVAHFGLMQRFTYVVYWSLYPIINSYQYQAYSMRGYYDVCEQNLVGLRARHDGWSRQVFFKLLEG